jgi:hypothetical protein
MKVIASLVEFVAAMAEGGATMDVLEYARKAAFAQGAKVFCERLHLLAEVQFLSFEYVLSAPVLLSLTHTFDVADKYASCTIIVAAVLCAASDEAECL